MVKKASTKAAGAAKEPKAKTDTQHFNAIDDTAVIALWEAGSQGCYIPVAAVESLKHFGYIEVNESMKDGDGNIVARLTEAGMKWVPETYEDLPGSEGAKATPLPATKAENSTGFVIRDDVSFPVGKRRFSTAAPKYPFASLNVGQSFHLPVTEETPRPWARYASSITTANKRFADETPPRKFTIRAVGKDDPDGEGARVFRTT